MIIKILQEHFVIVQGIEPLPYTISKKEEIAKRKIENKTEIKWDRLKNEGFKCVKVDIHFKSE